MEILLIRYGDYVNIDRLAWLIIMIINAVWIVWTHWVVIVVRNYSRIIVISLIISIRHELIYIHKWRLLLVVLHLVVLIPNTVIHPVV